jgi:hypothetical protein
MATVLAHQHHQHRHRATAPPVLPVGRYSIKLVNSGFKTWTIPEVTLAIGDRLREDVRLELGSLQQSVEVPQARRPCRRTASLSNLISTNAMQNLPFNGRNFVSLAQLIAGASVGESTGLPSGTRPDDRALFGVAVLNGVVLVSYILEFRERT